MQRAAWGVKARRGPPHGLTANAVLGWFRDLRIITGLDDQLHLMETTGRMQAEAGRTEVVQFLRALDLSIEDLTLEDSTESEP